jgi:hypothetical protein
MKEKGFHSMKKIIATGALLLAAGISVLAPGMASATTTAAVASSVTPDTATSATVHYTLQAQANDWYCGPAATRTALTSWGKTYSQSTLAADLGTTTDGTNSAADVTRVLNKLTGTGYYATKWISGYNATSAQKALLKSDVVFDISRGHAIVANVLGNANGAAPYDYSDGHYLTIVGYRDSGAVSVIADPAYGGHVYSMNTSDVANWIAERGYSA